MHPSGVDPAQAQRVSQRADLFDAYPLGDLAYSLLNATKVYIEFRNAVSWKWKTNLSNTRRES